MSDEQVKSLLLLCNIRYIRGHISPQTSTHPALIAGALRHVTCGGGCPLATHAISRDFPSVASTAEPTGITTTGGSALMKRLLAPYTMAVNR